MPGEIFLNQSHLGGKALIRHMLLGSCFFLVLCRDGLRATCSTTLCTKHLKGLPSKVKSTARQWIGEACWNNCKKWKPVN